MSIQFWLSAVFVLALLIILIVERKKIKLQKLLFPFLYIIIYRSKLGVVWMDRIAKRFPRSLKVLAFLSVVIGFLGMAFICIALVQNTVSLFTKPGAAPGIQPVLPINVKGVFFVPFLYWIMAIFIIAVIHEFAHGVIARLYGMDVKSSGFLFIGILLPIIPAAFVEPDEKKVVKKTAMQQYAMFSSGAFSNLVFAGITLLILLFVASPLAENIFQIDGVKVVELTAEGPAALAGIKEGEIIKIVDDVEIKSLKDFTDFLSEAKPGQRITLQTDRSSYGFLLHANPKDPSKPLVGISASENFIVKEAFKQRYGKLSADIFLWIVGLLNWLFLLNMGIGLFNLAPLSVLDGGRMFRLAMQRIFTQQGGDKIWRFVSLVFSFLIVVNVLFGFLK